MMDIRRHRRPGLLRFLVGLIGGMTLLSPALSGQAETWIDKPRSEWPQITMINRLIGIMSQKYGRNERLGPIAYPKRIIEAIRHEKAG